MDQANVQVKKKKRPNRVWKGIKRYKFVYLLGLPGFAIIVLFNYLPMYGILAAFQDFSCLLYTSCSSVRFKKFGL